MSRAVLFFGLSFAFLVVALGVVAMGLSTPGALELRPAGWNYPNDSAAGEESIAAVRASDSYGDVPMYFEPNQGQTDPSVEFLARGRGYMLFLTRNEAVLVPSPDGGISNPVRMSFLGANPDPRVSGLERMPGQSNYLAPCMVMAGTVAPHFKRVGYEQVYPGIDLVFYSDGGHLEFDFVVAPATDPGLIRLGFAGAESLSVDGVGDLVVETGSGAFVQHAPVIYQEVDGVRRGVTGGYEVDDSGELSFSIGDYDLGLPLVIDPLISYSTYLGSGASDTPHGIAVDSGGHAYITGDVQFSTFPTTGPNIGYAGGTLVLVTKLNTLGNGLVYSTFIGGCMGDDLGHGIAVDATGNAYVTGNTTSADFPTLLAPQKILNGTDDAFLLKLNTAGSALVYSTYYGGGASDSGIDVAVDTANQPYVTGDTSSSDFPTWNAQQGVSSSGANTFVLKLSSGAGIQYSTFLGGSAAQNAGDIVVDASGNAYVTGATTSTNFPTLNPFQGANASVAGSEDAYVSKLAADGSLMYSTYLGGAGDDNGLGIDADSGGNVFLAGSTESSDFPTANAYDGAVGGNCANFITKLNSAGNGLVYSTYLGGTGACGFNTDIAVDDTGSAHVVGWTGSSSFPTVNPIQGSISNWEDGFVTRFSPGGQSLLFSTYLGGGGFDDCRNVALDSDGNTYVLGATNSDDFPTSNAFQPTRAGGGDLFITKIIEPLGFFMAAAPVAAEKLQAQEQ